MGHARGEVGKDGGVLVIRRIHVEYRGLVITDEHRATIEKVHGFHKKGCPVYRSLQAAIDITTSIGDG